MLERYEYECEGCYISAGQMGNTSFAMIVITNMCPWIFNLLSTYLPRYAVVVVFVTESCV